MTKLAQDPTEIARLAYVAAAGGLGAAVTQEHAILSAGGEYLPAHARIVLRGGAPTTAYYRWLVGQLDRARRGDTDDEVHS